MSFSAQIAKFGGNASERVQQVRRGVMLKLFSAVIRDTPVDTGRLRANWQISEGSPNLSERTEIETNKKGNIAKGKSAGVVYKEIEALIKQSDGDTSLFLTNNLSYAGRVEFEGWSHTKAPEGMVRRNVVRFGRLIKVELNKK